MKYPQIFRRIQPYTTFLIVPQGLLNCQLSTVNCQLKNNLPYYRGFTVEGPKGCASTASVRNALAGRPAARIVRGDSPHKEKEEDETAFLCISVCLTQPRQPEPDDRCRYRKPCRLCGALRAHRTWGKPQRWERTASSWSHGAYRGGPWTLYT